MKAILKNNSDIDFYIQVPGKWILAGEHAVIRGGNAIVFPLASRYLNLTYFKTDAEIDIKLVGNASSELELIIWSVFEKALNKLQLKRGELKGLIELDSHILFGAGMGASATLCVALTEFFWHLGYVDEAQKYAFATDLENLFHGESSGVDVAVTLFQKPLLFSRHLGFQSLAIKNQPLLFLSHTGVRGVTKDCVDKVKSLFVENKELAEKIDQEMKEAVQNFQSLLVEPLNLSAWVETMRKAHHCFEQWGLVSEAVKAHGDKLIEAGAVAIKLTGSGGGGFILSLWEKAPTTMPFEMIPCFNQPLSEK